MKLFEFKKLPERFGKARIEYCAGEPRRAESVITIPTDGLADLYPLDNCGKRDQFILVWKNRYWFGGTDENPFLVEIRYEPVDAFLRSGPLREVEFYEKLRYSNVDNLSKKVGRRWKRQGDIFAIPIGMGWSRLIYCFRVCGKGLDTVEDTSNLLGTRHILCGRRSEFHSDGFSRHTIFGVSVHTLASGLISAPDHSPLFLGDKPHAIFQTAHLIAPYEAD